MRHQEGGCDRGIHQHDLEGEAVHSGDRGDAREWNVVDLRGAQQVPGKSRDVGARQLDGNPDERREDQRAQAESVAPRGNQGEQKSKQPVIQGEIQGVHQQQQQRGGDANPAVHVHDIEDPIATAEVPDDAADITEQEALPRRRGRKKESTVGERQGDILLAALQDGVNQRGQRHPAQQVKCGLGEDQHLENA